MNRRQADIVAGGLVVSVVLVGLALFWQEFQRRQQTGGMMRHMEPNTVDPFWILGATVLVAGVIGGAYLFVRDEFAADSGARETVPTATSENAEADSPTLEDEDQTESEETKGRPLLDMLPEDERTVLQPVIDSPGITQVELRDRASFSKSKVSQTVADLEKRGLLYREKQGRTYRVYPTEDVQSTDSG